jgi:hypothetical protein
MCYLYDKLNEIFVLNQQIVIKYDFRELSGENMITSLIRAKYVR